MFGYVRPLRGELRCADLDLYHAYYCGLCRTMRGRCGLISALALNYDFTFLALLLSGGVPGQKAACRCPVPPFRRKCVCEASEALEIAADESVILTWWQLGDKIRDSGFLRGLSARLARGALAPAYSRAARRRHAFNSEVCAHLDRLHTLETERCPAVDPPADAFACLLRAAAPSTGDESRDRPMAQLLYHLGRWIYLIDARDDLADDARSGAYNPVALRWPDADRDKALNRTLDQSLSLMRSAAALLDFGERTALVENVISLGLPAVQRAVFAGTRSKEKRFRFGEGTYE